MTMETEQGVEAGPEPVIAFLEAVADGLGAGSGACAVVMEAGQPRAFGVGMVGASAKRAALAGLIWLLEETPRDRPLLVLNANNPDVATPIRRGWGVGWVKRKWHQANGKPVSEADLWQKAFALMEGRSVVVGGGSYSDGTLCPSPLAVAREEMRLAFARDKYVVEPWVRRYASDRDPRVVAAEADKAGMVLVPREPPGPAVPGKFVLVHVAGQCEFGAGECPGGWAALVVHGERRRLLTGGEGATTAHRMILTGVIEALKESPPDAAIEVRARDAELMESGAKWLPGWRVRGWRRANGEPVPEQEQWEEVVRLAAGRPVTWTEVQLRAAQPGDHEVMEQARAEMRGAARKAGWAPPSSGAGSLTLRRPGAGGAAAGGEER